MRRKAPLPNPSPSLREREGAKQAERIRGPAIANAIATPPAGTRHRQGAHYTARKYHSYSRSVTWV